MKPDGLGAWPTVLLAWAVPGAGHFAHGHTRKGTIFLVILTFMYAIGLVFGGRLFPLQMSDVLVGLAAVAQWACGVPRLLSALIGAGEGRVIAETYEYGNAFLITSGLLNMLVALDAYDVATGRKPMVPPARAR